MNAQVINKIEELIQTLNQKQQIIANKIKLENNYRFFESTVRGNPEVFFEDKSNKNIYHLITYIKNICQCD